MPKGRAFPLSGGREGLNPFPALFFLNDLWRFQVKKVLLSILCYSINLACDAALIHNFFYKDNWNKYCENYITMYEILSWVLVACMLINILFLIVLNTSPEALKKGEKAARKVVESNGRLVGRIWYFVNSLPMLFFVWVFVGDVSLGIVWGICALLSPLSWNLSKSVKEKLSTINDPGIRLADQLKGSYPNN